MADEMTTPGQSVMARLAIIQGTLEDLMGDVQRLQVEVAKLQEAAYHSPNDGPSKRDRIVDRLYQHHDLVRQEGSRSCALCGARMVWDDELLIRE